MAEAASGFADSLAAPLALYGHAVAAVAAIGDVYAEVAESWQAAETRIRERYQQVLDAVAAGVQLPRDGRFIDGGPPGEPAMQNTAPDAQDEHKFVDEDGGRP